MSPSVFMITIQDDDSESGRMYSCGGVVWWGLRFESGKFAFENIKSEVRVCKSKTVRR